MSIWGYIGRDASPHHTSATLELASAPIESINTSGPWYDVEEGCYIEEPAPGVGSREQHGVPSTPAQAQLQTFPQSCKPISPTGKVSAVLLEACQWSLRSTPSLTLPTAAMMGGGLRRTWLNGERGRHALAWGCNLVQV
jgi:hypothetical protein